MDEEDIKKIKETTEEFLQKMTVADFNLELKTSSVENRETSTGGAFMSFITGAKSEWQDIVDLNIKLKEPQILIGSGGQTLFELERILKIVLTKKLGKFFYLKLDINDYKKKKIEYLKDLAKSIADEVAITKENKILPPMPSYQRRIIHTELSERKDIITESEGDGEDRHIIIRPK